MDKITRAEELRLQLADEIVRGALAPGSALDETDIRALLRGGATDADIAVVLRQSVADKWEGHEINTARFIKPERLMHSIGG